MQLTVREAAGLLAVSENTLYRWIRDGKIPAHRVNEQYRLNRTELLEFATANRLNVSPEIFGNADETSGAAQPSLVEALREGGIHHGVAGCEKTEVLRAVVGLMPLPAQVDRGFLLEMLLARESLGSTGIGDGIAIPHVRNPIVLQIPRAMITLCFLESPIDFEAIDGKPVGVLFTILSPTVRAHLHILSRLAFLLRDDAFRALLSERAGPEEILDAFGRLEAYTLRKR